MLNVIYITMCQVRSTLELRVVRTICCHGILICRVIVTDDGTSSLGDSLSDLLSLSIKTQARRNIVYVSHIM